MGKSSKVNNKFHGQKCKGQLAIFMGKIVNMFTKKSNYSASYLVVPTFDILTCDDVLLPREVLVLQAHLCIILLCILCSLG